ncbi:hypothetical protein AVEN_23541-1 [Araneus ventricosus]|uniref:Uncharacterized protein n=1 Tax=Araneus ventricosus TaxID=182803 RepID=A0A4Y2PD62_ARAVE|nr:hypothetical protein AVEN_23541-1 [Araneus ventricosus]
MLLTHLPLPESSLDVSEIPYQTNCKRSIPPQRLYQIKQFPVDMLGPWIHEVVSIPVRVHLPDTIGNETRQTRQLVSSHQQFNGGVGEAMCRTINNGTRVGYRFRKPISMMVRSTVRTLTFLNTPALKSAVI